MNSSASSRESAAPVWWFWVLIPAYAPILWWHLSGMLQKPHYQFVIVVPFLIWALLQNRDEVAARGNYRGSWLILLGLLLGMALLGLASWAWSPWAAMVSALIVVFCLAWFRTGWNGFSQWFPAWVMGIVLLPLPFGWDERLTLGLRNITTRITSEVLDLFGSLHASYVNVIEIPGHKLFVADACSGVHSLFVLLAASLFWSLFNRRTVLHTVLLLLSSFSLVLLENVARLVIVVLGFSWRMDLSSGPDHAALGFILFVVSTLLIMSLDQLLRFLLPSTSSWFFWSRSRKTNLSEDRFPLSAAVRGAGLFLSMLLPVFGGLQWIRMPGRLPDLTTSFRTEPALKDLGEEGLPKQVQGFERLEFSRIERVIGDPFGQHSQQWTYSSGPLVAQISVDYPYGGFHDATVCYSQVGWNIQSAIVPEQTSAEPVAVVEIARALDGEAMLLFSQLDQDGIIYARLKDRDPALRIESARRRFEAMMAGPAPQAATPLRLPLLQIQMLVRSTERLTSEDRARMLAFYQELRTRIRQSLDLGKHPPATTISDQKSNTSPDLRE